jgi:hypothetical protein
MDQAMPMGKTCIGTCTQPFYLKLTHKSSQCFVKSVLQCFTGSNVLLHMGNGCMFHASWSTSIMVPIMDVTSCMAQHENSHHENLRGGHSLLY